MAALARSILGTFNRRRKCGVFKRARESRCYLILPNFQCLKRIKCRPVAELIVDPSKSGRERLYGSLLGGVGKHQVRSGVSD